MSKTDSLGGKMGGVVGGGGPKLGPSKSKGVEKGRRGKLVKSSSQPMKAPAPFQMAGLSGFTGGGIGSSLGIGDSYSTPDISPLRSSANPTPEPGAMPPKRPKLSSSSSSSSSSGSSSSDPENMMEDMASHVQHHVTQQRPATTTTISPARPIQTSGAEALRMGGGGGGVYVASSQKSAASSSQAVLFHSQKGNPLSRSSSAGRPVQGQLSSGRSSVPGFVSESQQPQHQHLTKSSSAHDMVPSIPQSTAQALSVKHQAAMMASDVTLSRSSIKPGTSVGGSLPTAVSRPAPGVAAPTVVEMVVSSSGSSSISDSSSDSSSSDSSSGDSEAENDREVVSVG